MRAQFVSQLNCKARAFREDEPNTSERNTDNSAKFFFNWVSQQGNNIPEIIIQFEVFILPRVVAGLNFSDSSSQFAMWVLLHLF